LVPSRGVGAFGLDHDLAAGAGQHGHEHVQKTGTDLFSEQPLRPRMAGGGPLSGAAMGAFNPGPLLHHSSLVTHYLAFKHPPLALPNQPDRIKVVRNSMR
jgi:hypothetical protein